MHGSLGAAQHTAGLTFLFKGSLGGRKCTILLDTGASFSLVSAEWLQENFSSADLAEDSHELAQPIRLTTANGQVLSVHKEFRRLVQIQQAKLSVSAKIMSHTLNGIDVILGMDTLSKHTAKLDCAQSTCELTVNKKTVKLKTEADKTRDRHLSSCSVAAAQGAARSKYLSPHQAAKLLKQGCCSWLLVVQRKEKPAGAACASVQEKDPVPGLMDPAVLEQIKVEFHDVFEPITSCPPRRADVDHTIRLEPNTTPTFRRPHRLSKQEEQEIHSQVADLLAKGLIEPSVSPYGAPVLFVQKKDGSLRMCIDYRALNKVTVRDRYPLPRIDDLLDKLHGCSVFSSLDLQSGYHQIRITDEDKPKTAMITPLGQFQFKVLCFGLTNAPATFQRVMNRVFQEHIGKFVLVYLDDILVMSRSPQEHAKHLRIVLGLLRQHQLRVKLKKCEFNKPELSFLGHIVGKDGIAVGPAKVAVIEKWPLPRTLKELQAFLGLGNYFRKFVHHFSTMVAPLTALTSKAAAQAFNWNDWGQAELTAFKQLKHALISAPVLAVPDRDSPFQVHTDASVVGTGGVLLQGGRVVAYSSTKFTPAEKNYGTPEQELLGLIRALQVWRCYLEGCEEAELITDHHPLTHLQTQPNLSRRQARWMEFLSRFPFVIKYQPGAGNVADPVSRNPLLYDDNTPASVIAVLRAMGCKVMKRTAAALVVTRGRSRADAVPNPPLPPPQQEPPPTLEPGGGERPSLPVPAAGTPLRERRVASVDCPDETLAREILSAYRSDARFRDPAFTRAYSRRSDGIWMHGEKVVVPASPLLRRRVIAACHDEKMSGHVGITKTVDLVSRSFHREGLRTSVEDYVRHCDACQRHKASTRKHAGLMQPLPIPGRRWESVSMDLIVKLPQTAAKHDSILVFVDRLSKMVHLVPTTESLDAIGFARLFVDHVVRLHGMPATLVSDRGPQFNNKFWEHVCKLTGLRRCMSSAYHPQTDGQTERTNRTLEEMLKSYVAPDQLDWDEHLACAEFAINNSWQESVRNTPFFLNYGQHPLTPASLSLPRIVPKASDFAEGIMNAVAKAKECLRAAQSRMSSRANEKRVERTYQSGDMVLLSAKNLKHGGPGVRKLKPSYLGPFEVDQMIGDSAVRLHLPPEWARIHNVFHVHLVKPYIGSQEEMPATQQWRAPPPLQFLDGEPLYKVEQLLNHRIVRHGRRAAYHFLVRWEGYPPEHDTWEPEKNLLSCDSLIALYKAGHGLMSRAADML